MINQVKKIWYNYKLSKGIKFFEKSNITTTSAYSSLRKMFVLTRGNSNDRISAAINKRIGKYELDDQSGILGNLSDFEIKNMIETMERDGFYIFDKLLPENLTDELYNYGLTIPCQYLDIETKAYSKQEVFFNPLQPISPRYQFSNSSIINLPSIQKLLFDKSLLAFAQEYLGVRPILDLIAFWWSLPFEGKGKSEAAQMYHFDMDRIKFMKFFFYLTDVDTNNGPHCYVRGSHKHLPERLARDGRFSDEEIIKEYGIENIVEICGKKGSIIAVDTRGFHKGKELVQSNRLIFQIEFANSMFGQNYPPLSIQIQDKDAEWMYNKYPYTYGQIFSINRDVNN